MTVHIDQIKREVDQSMTEYRHYRDNRDMARSIVNKTIDYLHSRGLLNVSKSHDRVCEECGNVFQKYVSPAKVKKGEGRFCSKSCATTVQRREEKYGHRAN